MSKCMWIIAEKIYMKISAFIIHNLKREWITNDLIKHLLQSSVFNNRRFSKALHANADTLMASYYWYINWLWRSFCGMVFYFFDRTAIENFLRRYSYSMTIKINILITKISENFAYNLPEVDSSKASTTNNFYRFSNGSVIFKIDIRWITKFSRSLIHWNLSLLVYRKCHCLDILMRNRYWAQAPIYLIHTYAFNFVAILFVLTIENGTNIIIIIITHSELPIEFLDNNMILHLAG